MEHRAANLARIMQPFLIGLHFRPWHGFRHQIALQSRPAEPFTHHAQPRDNAALVTIFCQIIRVDGRLFAGVCAAGCDEAAAFRAHLPNAGGHAGLRIQNARCPRRVTRRSEQRLHIGRRAFRQRLKGSREKRCRIGQHPTPQDSEFQHLTGQAQAARAFIQSRHILHNCLHAHQEMILKIPPHAAQFMQHRNAEPRQMLRIPHTRKLQYMRGANGTGGENYLHRRIRAFSNATARKLHSHGALAFEDHAMHQSIGHNTQIRPAHGRAQIGTRGTRPEPPAARLLHPANMIAKPMRQIIQIIAVIPTHLLARFNRRLTQFRLVA